MFLFHGIVKTQWSNTTKHTKDHIINWLKETNIDDRVIDERKKPEDKENSSEKNGDTNNHIYGLVFTVLFVDIIIFDKRYFLYTSSPIPDFIIT